MAKFGRFDPRNKKQGRNKQRSIYKDIRMHDIDKGRKISGIKVNEIWVDEWANVEGEYDDEDDRV
jgi:hypothetical protein